MSPRWPDQGAPPTYGSPFFVAGNKLYLVCVRCNARIPLAIYREGIWAQRGFYEWKALKGFWPTHTECVKNERGIGLGLHVRLESDNANGLAIGLAIDPTP